MRKLRFAKKMAQFNRLKRNYSGKWFKIIYLLTKNRSISFKRRIFEFLSENTCIDKRYLKLRVFTNDKKYLKPYQKLRLRTSNRTIHIWRKRDYKAQRRKFFYKQIVIENKKFREYKHNSYKQYVRAVRRYSLKQIEQYGLKDFEKRSKTFHIDHIVSIKCGFVLNIPYKLIGDIHNLRMLSDKENASKNGDVDVQCIDKTLFKNYLNQIKGFRNAWIYRYSASSFNKI